MSKPYFSIIIPTLNESRYLPHLLSDLINQTYKDFEVVIVDGHSTDNTLDLARGFQDRLAIKLVTSPRRHVCSQRNLGASHAQANILIFSDADNRLPPYFFQGVKYRLDVDNPDIANFWIRPDKKTPSTDLVAIGINLGTEIQNSFQPRFMLESLIVIKASVFNTLNGFDENINYAEGVDFITSAANHGFQIKTFRDPTYSYSFRRFRKYGTLTTLKNTTKLGLGSLLGKEYKNINAKKLYPMLGGTLFNKPKKAKNKFLKNILKLLKDL